MNSSAGKVSIMFSAGDEKDGNIHFKELTAYFQVFFVSSMKLVKICCVPSFVKNVN